MTNPDPKQAPALPPLEASRHHALGALSRLHLYLGMDDNDEYDEGGAVRENIRALEDQIYSLRMAPLTPSPNPVLLPLENSTYEVQVALSRLYLDLDDNDEYDEGGAVRENIRALADQIYPLRMMLSPRTAAVEHCDGCGRMVLPSAPKAAAEPVTEQPTPQPTEPVQSAPTNTYWASGAAALAAATQEDECLTLLPASKGGYGLMHSKTHKVRYQCEGNEYKHPIHRVVFGVWHDLPYNDLVDLIVERTCDTPNCIYPLHLDLKSRSERLAKSRRKQGS